MASPELKNQPISVVEAAVREYLSQIGCSDWQVQGIGPLHKGAFSMGAVVTLMNPNNGRQPERIFVKVGRDTLPATLVEADLKLGCRNLPHLVSNFGVFYLSGELPFSVLEALPDDAVQLLDILKPYGLQTVQTQGAEQTCSIDQLGLIYRQAMVNLGEIHQQPLNLSVEDQQAALKKYHRHLIESPTRLAGIANIYFNEIPGEKNITSPMFDDLCSLMRRLAEKIEQNSGSNQRIRPVHGDSWAANTFWLPKTGEVKFIDPELALADPALDVCFMLADLAFSGNAKLIELAETLLAEFRLDDPDIDQGLALAFGYKGFVSAVFDCTTKEQQLGRFESILMIINEALENKQFSFLKLGNYSKALEREFPSPLA